MTTKAPEMPHRIVAWLGDGYSTPRDGQASWEDARYCEDEGVPYIRTDYLTSDEAIERAARAIRNVTASRNDLVLAPWETVSPYAAEHYTRLARAALEAALKEGS